jgi:predicted Ser/Thr protein kinase
MSVPDWDIRGDAAMAGDRDRVVTELKRRDAARNRLEESAMQRARPTFVVRSSTNGDKLSSWANGTARHVPITAADGWFNLPNGTRARSIRAILVAIGYVSDDESESDDDIDNDTVDRFQHTSIAIDEVKLPPSADLSLDAKKPMASGAFDDVVNGRLAPRRIARRELSLYEAIGEGSFGVVWRAMWNECEVAVKVLKREWLSDKKMALKFKAEIEHMASIARHANVVELFGWTEVSNGSVGAVVEYCGAGSLAQLLFDKNRQDSDAFLPVSVALDAAHGIRHLHEHHVVHRDIAARNVMLVDDGGARLVGKVTDFGLARVTRDGTVDHSAASPVDGPVRWMAPEQLASMQFSKASDVFAFGVLLFEIFARQTPWGSMHPYLVASEVTSGKRMDVPDEVPEPMRLLMTGRCWQQEAKARPTMQEVVEEIEEYNKTLCL